MHWREEHDLCFHTILLAGNVKRIVEKQLIRSKLSKEVKTVRDLKYISDRVNTGGG